MRPMSQVGDHVFRRHIESGTGDEKPRVVNEMRGEPEGRKQESRPQHSVERKYAGFRVLDFALSSCESGTPIRASIFDGRRTS